MDKKHVIVADHEAAPGSHRSYIIGFLLSVFMTLDAYMLVVRHALHGNALLASIMVLAIAQLFVQLLFFLHLGRESKPRWNLMAFLFMALVLLIVVLGSLWIMKHLNYHDMTPAETNHYLHDHEGI